MLVSKVDDKNIEVRLADLGISTFLGGINREATMFIGTKGFTAPEMINGQAYGLPFDIWSLGVVVHTLLFHKLPFDGEDESEQDRRICNEPLNLENMRMSTQVSPQAKDLVQKMMIKDPADRITIQQVMAHPWITDAIN